MSIHPTAIVDPSVKMGSGNIIGPYCVIGPGVEMGNDNHLVSHVVLEKNVRMGNANRIAAFSSIGGASQSVHDAFDDETYVEIGNHNNFYEYCTVNRGSKLDKQVTRIGDHNHFLASTHVAHDCIVHNHVVLINHATLGGHVTVDNHARLGAFVAVRQFCHIGQHAFMVEACQIIKDVLPYTIVVGSDCRVRGVNKEGLRRHDYSPEAMRLIDEAFRIVYKSALVVPKAIEALQVLEKEEEGAVIAPIRTFLQRSARGIVR